MEAAIEDRWFNFREFSPFERELAARKRAGDPIKFASKRKVQKAMVSSFEKAFGRLGLFGSGSIGQQLSYVRMKCAGWVVQTDFTFGRSSNQIRHSHVIVSQETIPHPTTPGVTGPALLLENGICWIGLGHMTHEYLTDADVEPACDSVITVCREFFDELPKLLKGIERDKVTE